MIFWFILLQDIVCNKAEWRISKRLFQENKACQIFRKTNISYPLIRTRININVSFSENFANVLNEWTLLQMNCASFFLRKIIPSTGTIIFNLFFSGLSSPSISTLRKTGLVFFNLLCIASKIFQNQKGGGGGLEVKVRSFLKDCKVTGKKIWP